MTKASVVLICHSRYMIDTKSITDHRQKSGIVCTICKIRAFSRSVFARVSERNIVAWNLQNISILLPSKADNLATISQE